MIDPIAAGKLERRFAPVRRGLVVDAVRRAERFGALKLLVARRCNDHRDAHGAGELKAENRDATGALDQ